MTIYGKIGGASAAANETAAQQAKEGISAEVGLPTPPPSASAAPKQWSDYPIGTKAHAVNGGCWTKTERGWQWGCGATFPTPGADVARIELTSSDTSETPDDEELSTGPGTIIHGMANKDESSETPLTDENERKHGALYGGCVDTEFARDLERRLRAAESAYRASGRTNTYEGGNLHDWWERAIKAERELAALAKTVGTYQAELKHECQNSETQEARAEAAERERDEAKANLSKLANAVEQEGCAVSESGYFKNWRAELAEKELASVKADAERYLALRKGNAGDWKIGRRSLVHGGIDWVFGTAADDAIYYSSAAKGGKT